MSIPLRLGMRVSWLMEAVAAVAIVLAFLNWLQAAVIDKEILGVRYTRLEILRPRELLAAVSAAVILLALFVIVSVLFRAVKGENRKLSRWTRGLGVLNLLIVVWFVSVDESVYREACPVCLNARHVHESRAFSWLIRRDVFRWRLPRIGELIAADLGTPCLHPRPERLRLGARSGLCLWWDGGFMWLYDRPAYPPCARSAVAARLAADPGLPATFRKRVLEEHDRAYLRAFVDRMYSECPDSELPEYLHKSNRASSVFPVP